MRSAMASWTVPPNTPEIKEIKFERELRIFISFRLQKTYIKKWYVNKWEGPDVLPQVAKKTSLCIITEKCFLCFETTHVVRINGKDPLVLTTFSYTDCCVENFQYNLLSCTSPKQFLWRHLNYPSEDPELNTTLQWRSNSCLWGRRWCMACLCSTNSCQRCKCSPPGRKKFDYFSCNFFML